MQPRAMQARDGLATDADRADPLWRRLIGIALLLLIYGGVLCMLVWAMVTYPIDH